MKSIRTLLFIPVAAVVLAGCSQQATTSTDTATETDSIPAVMETTETTNMQAQDADFTVESSNFKFSVPEMKVKAGQTVTVKLVNVEGTHDFVIDEIEGAKTSQITGEGEETITFTVPADAAGKTFEYYCSYMKHREMGMIGKMIVE